MTSDELRHDAPPSPVSEGQTLSQQALIPGLPTILDHRLLRRQLSWLIGIRLVVVTSVALLYFLLTLIPAEPLRTLSPRFLFLLAGLTYVASLGYIGLLRMVPGREALHAYAQFLGDLGLITALVYWFGGAVSPFSMLYLVVISIAAALLRRSAGVLVANVAYVLFASISLSLYFGWIPPPNELSAETTALPRLLYNLTTHLFGFYGIALLTSYLARDVTLAERKLVERTEDLADLQVAYQDVVQSMSSGLVTAALDGTLTSVNRLGESLLHREADELVDRHLVETGLLDEEAWARLVVIAQQGGKVRRESEIEILGESRSFGYTAAPLCDAHGEQTGYLVVFQDLTEWHKLEEEVRIKDRMAAVGELAAGIAHEIGNPLAAISGSVQMLLPSAQEDSAREKLLQIVLRESRRLDRTIKGFLQFARPKEASSVRFDIARLLAEHVELLGNSEELTDRHTVRLDLDPASATVVADPDQIAQIFWNLSRNALRAMPEGGTLQVAGRVVDSRYRLEMRDTGCGMTPDERANLFHPFKSFFDQGTGIGMAIVYRIVEEHGGELHVESTPEEGTTIVVELPSAEVGAPRAVEEPVA